MTTYTYFAIPLDKIPQPPPYKAVWYAAWSSVRPILGSNTHVGNVSQLPPPFVIGATTGDLPGTATLIGKGPRSRYPAPPPLSLPMTTTGTSYFSSFQHWLASGTDPQICSYFSIPFADVPAQPSYVTWFGTWALSPPTIDAAWLPPMAIGVIAGAVPAGGTFIVNLDKDPIPPPVLGVPDTTLASYAKWLTDRAA